MPIPSRFTGEILGRYKPFPAWEAKAFLSDLVSRVVDVDRSLPGSGKASLAQTAAYFEYACEIKAFVREYALSVGIDPSASLTVEGESIAVYDWSCLDYPRFEALVAQIDAALRIQVPDLNALAPSWVSAMGPLDDARWVLAKLLATLGITDFHAAFIAVLEEGWSHLLEALAQAIVARDWERVRVLMKKLLDVIISSEFFERLAARIGRAAAARLIGGTLARFLPVVGWVWLIGSFIWAVAEEFI